MNNIQLEAAKTSLNREILGIDDAGQLERVKHLLHSFREEEKAPCRLIDLLRWSMKKWCPMAKKK